MNLDQQLIVQIGSIIFELVDIIVQTKTNLQKKKKL